MKMNIKTTTSPRAQGSVLLIALILCAIMGITLASYLVMATTEEKTVRRSQVWNGCLAYGEAGVEDALAHLNSPSGFSGVLVIAWPTGQGFAWSSASCRRRAS